MEGIELSHTESPDTRSVDYNCHSSGVNFLEILCSLACLECHGALCSKPHHLEFHSPSQLFFTVQQLEFELTNAEHPIDKFFNIHTFLFQIVSCTQLKHFPGLCVAFSLWTNLDTSALLLATLYSNTENIGSAGQYNVVSQDVHNMDAEKEVTDIDLRLHALQNFLKSAKDSAVKK